MSHVYIYEGGGIAFNSGCQVQAITGDRGRITADQVEAHINPLFDYKARTRLICVENTTNRGGGSCYDLVELEKIKKVCQTHNLAFHLDGARLWNALCATGASTSDFGRLFDSISVCLSKGLGAPAGSLVVGDKEFIARARRVRKVLGGGMRQAGYYAAAGIYALDHHFKRLDEDHRHAKIITAALEEKEWVESILPADTNIIIFNTRSDVPAQAICERLEQEKVKAMATAVNQIRMVTHLGVTAEMVDRLLLIVQRI